MVSEPISSAALRALDAATVVVRRPDNIIVGRHSNGVAASIQAARLDSALGAKLCFPTYHGCYTPAEAARITKGGAL